MPGDIFAFHGGDDPSIQWGEARTYLPAGKYPTEPGQPPNTESSAHSVSTAKAENLP